MSSNQPTGPDFFRTGPTRWIVLAAACVVVALVVLSITVWFRPSTTTASDKPTHTATAPVITPTATPVPTATPTSNASTKGTTKGILRASEPVKLTAKPQVATGVTIEITSMKAVKGVANGPGQVAGPSVQVAIAVVNKTSKTVNLATAVINGYYGSANTPADELSGPGVVQLPASVAAGKTAKAVSVFSIPTDNREIVSVTFDYTSKDPVVVFQGKAPS